MSVRRGICCDVVWVGDAASAMILIAAQKRISADVGVGPEADYVWCGYAFGMKDSVTALAPRNPARHADRAVASPFLRSLAAVSDH